jgi:hypothetical protein
MLHLLDSSEATIKIMDLKKTGNVLASAVKPDEGAKPTFEASILLNNLS